MLNVTKTKEQLGYEVSLTRVRRTADQRRSTNNIQPKNLDVIDNCPTCNIERTITLRQSRKNKPCSKCFHNSVTMVNIKKSNTKNKSQEHKQKMCENHWSKRGVPSAFKGRTHTEETRKNLAEKQRNVLQSLSNQEKLRRYQKASCTARSIDINEFNGWGTDEGVRLRGSREYREWENQVIERDARCQFPGCLERRSNYITVHHKDGFSWAKDRRLDVDNGVLLCQYHHTKGPDSFHNLYGRHDSTKAQYDEWIHSYSFTPQKERHVYVVTGAPGSGKSWICGQLTDNYKYVSYDDFPKESHLHMMLSYTGTKSILYDPWRKASSFLKRYGNIFTVHLLVINESEEVVRERVIGRGGHVDDNTTKYVKRASGLAKNAEFAGTSDEVLHYLRTLRFVN